MALGSGVILGNGVSVFVGGLVGGTGVMVKVAAGAAVRVCAFPVIARSGVGVAGTAAGAESVVRHADAISSVVSEIRRGLFALLMT